MTCSAGWPCPGPGCWSRRWTGSSPAQLDARPQPAEGVSLAPKITIEDARVRWAEPALAVDRRIRACTPGPGAWTMLGEARIKLWPLAAPPALTTADGRSAAGQPLAPGELRVQRTSVLVGTATEPVELGDVQPPGKRRMPAADWARGLRQTAAVLA